ncbi:MAG: tyrosine-type recombinase/integrase [Parcubacteria group bacterium]
MATTNKLQAMQVSKLSKPGLFSDGEGLYLRVDSGKRGVFIYHRHGKRKEMGLGPLSDVSLAQARELKREARQLVRAGKDPIEERKRARIGSITFGEFIEAELDVLEKGWSNPKHRQQWRNTLRTYAANCWEVPVNQIETQHVEKALRPIWLTKPETAKRLRGRIERLLDSAKAKGLRSGENPARWRGHLKSIMATHPRSARKHHAALPFDALPAFMERLRGLEAVSARALEFTILTAARTSEVLGATWDEIDLEKRIWTVPGGRMKMRAEHQVPLSDAAVKLLEGLKELGGKWVFPGTLADKPLSNMSMQMLLRRMKVPVTPHGFRSTFRDWAGEATDHSREVAEAALAHKVGNEVERAYRRGNSLEKRRVMMADWATYCSSITHS